MKKGILITALIVAILASPFLLNLAAITDAGKPVQTNYFPTNYSLTRDLSLPLNQPMASSVSGAIRIITEQYIPPNNGGPATTTASGTR